MQHVAVSALTHEGRLRDHNEDSMAVGPWTTCASVTNTPATLLLPVAEPVVVAVADGLGGHPAGDVASTLVVQEVARAGRALTDEDSVRSMLELCNRALYDVAQRDPDRTGMGTTIAGVVVDESVVRIFNIGDSRVYLVDDGGLQLLSIDDNPPLVPGQTHTSVLTQILGGYDEQQLDAHVSYRARSDVGRYLVCTDGLTDVVADDAIAAILRQSRGAEVAFELWTAAMDAGGPDNITVAVVEPEP